MKNIRRFTFSALTALVTAANAVALTASAEGEAVWDTPPEDLPEYILSDLTEFPMSFHFMLGEPNNSIYYVHAIEQPEDCKTEFTGVIHVTGVNDIFAGVFYNMPDYLSTASECEWGTYAKRKDNPMTAEEAKALGEQLLQDGQIKSYQLVWRRIAETKDADINSDGSVAADDAQMVLREYVFILAGKPCTFTKEQRLCADVTNDNRIAANDAQVILRYYTDVLALKVPRPRKVEPPVRQAAPGALCVICRSRRAASAHCARGSVCLRESASRCRPSGS